MWAVSRRQSRSSVVHFQVIICSNLKEYRTAFPFHTVVSINNIDQLCYCSMQNAIWRGQVGLVGPVCIFIQGWWLFGWRQAVSMQGTALWQHSRAVVRGWGSLQECVAPGLVIVQPTWQTEEESQKKSQKNKTNKNRKHHYNKTPFINSSKENLLDSWGRTAKSKNHTFGSMYVK